MVTIEGDFVNGGPFVINGVGFGNRGTLMMGGAPVKTTSWNDRRIKGVLPSTGASSIVKVTTAEGKTVVAEWAGGK